MGTSTSSIEDASSDIEIDYNTEEDVAIERRQSRRNSRAEQEFNVSEGERRARQRLDRIRRHRNTSDSYTSEGGRAMRSSPRRSTRFSPLTSSGSGSGTGRNMDSTIDTIIPATRSNNSTERTSIFEAMRSRFSASSMTLLLNRLMFRNNSQTIPPSNPSMINMTASSTPIAQLAQQQLPTDDIVMSSSIESRHMSFTSPIPSVVESPVISTASVADVVNATAGENSSNEFTQQQSSTDTSSIRPAPLTTNNRGARTVPILILGIRPAPSSLPTQNASATPQPSNSEGVPGGGLRSVVASTLARLMLRRIRNSINNRHNESSSIVPLPTPIDTTISIENNTDRNIPRDIHIPPPLSPWSAMASSSTTDSIASGTQSNGRQAYLLYIITGNIELPPESNPPEGASSLNSIPGDLGNALNVLGRNPDTIINENGHMADNTTDDRTLLSSLFNPDIFMSNSNSDNVTAGPGGTSNAAPNTDTQQTVPSALLDLLGRILHEGAPNFMRSNTSPPGTTAANEGYEELLRLADLIGPARPRYCDIRDVESQLPILVHGAADDDGDVIMSQIAVRELAFEQDSNSSDVGNTKSTSDDRDTTIATTSSFNDLKKLRLSDLLASTNEKCSICLEHYESGEELRVMKCKHGFHKECLNTWLTKSVNSCPLCKTQAVIINNAPASLSSTSSSGIFVGSGGSSILGSGIEFLVMSPNPADFPFPFFPVSGTEDR